ncbi:glycoside hydrolase family protein [Neolewinella antarctica]|uniref:Uncharacterized protein n=1 Tax=Neolewinella antarctica TaxID=442734 RepID=A0ABX0XES9_9BACT|nr:hypothetical protein [Neolewinella antarctica]NJC27409.1 hypothetical protein [Neolewinella antarctica]
MLLSARALILLLLPCFLGTCARALPYPKTVRLPPQLKEASGLVIDGENYRFHNDSGDGPYVYTTDRIGQIKYVDTLAADAHDYEDITRDPAGNLYLADTGNNRGKRTDLRIYRYNRTSRRTDTIKFHYPGQDGGGRDAPSNYDCEAMVYQGGYLHLFTKDQLGGKKQFNIYHFRVPASPGDYAAELIDSLYLPRRVVTAAALDSVNKQLVLTSYSFKMVLGIIPTSAASLITISDYPAGRFLSGDLRRQNLSWGAPTQFEAVDFLDDKWLYVFSEGTVVRRRAVGKLKRRKGGR